MDTINLLIDSTEEITVGGEYTAIGPICLSWFAGADLPIESEGGKVVFNTQTHAPDSNGNYTVRLPVKDKQLKVISTEKVTIFKKELELSLAEGESDKYLIIHANGKKYAYKLPAVLAE